MNKLTTVKTITKAAPLALLAIVISGSASAGPPVGDPGSPKGEKLTIDVENHCVPNGRFLDVTTTVTPSDSKKGDGGAEIKTPTANCVRQIRVASKNAPSISCLLEPIIKACTMQARGFGRSRSTSAPRKTMRPLAGKRQSTHQFLSPSTTMIIQRRHGCRGVTTLTSIRIMTG